MGWTCLPYLLATGGSVTDTDMSAVADPVFTRRNNHYILTEQYNLGAAFGGGANATRFNIGVPSFNALTKFNLWPINLTSANVPSPPRLDWFYPAPVPLPMNEEIQIFATDTASENALAVLFPFTPQHTKNLPTGGMVIPARFTASVTQVANGWSAAAALTAEQSLRGGVYSILGGECVVSASLLWRLILPRQRQYHGRWLRPGFLIQQAIGDLPEPRMQIDPFSLGEWGRFHSFELPQVEVYGAAATSTVTAEVRLWLMYLGQDQQQYLNGWVDQGWQ